MDQWVAAKGEYTMGYIKQRDIPFHWALAEAFTICDNYHCSVLGPTNPNRLYMWTGMIDPAATGGGPIIDNTPGVQQRDPVLDDLPGAAAGRRHQLEGLPGGRQLRRQRPGLVHPVRQRAVVVAAAPARDRVRGQAGNFEDDARHDRLPQVSWLVAPTAQTEHPDYFPAAGAEYIAQKLDAIASNPEVWAKTAFILCYDENDGLFDHVPPPAPPAGTAAEFVDGSRSGWASARRRRSCRRGRRAASSAPRCSTTPR